MPDTPEPPKPEEQPLKRNLVTRRMLINILPPAAARLEALLHDEKEVGTALEAGVIFEGAVNTYMSALTDALKAVVEEQHWSSITVVDAKWGDLSRRGGGDSKGDSATEPLMCWIDIYEHWQYEPGENGRGLSLEVFPTGIRLSSTQDADKYVTVACPKLILDRLVSRQ